LGKGERSPTGFLTTHTPKGNSPHFPLRRIFGSPPHTPFARRSLFDMGRPVTMFTGQWADLPLAELARKCSGFGIRRARTGLPGRPFRGRQGARPGRLCAKKRELLEKTTSSVRHQHHLVGQAVLDNIGRASQLIVPPYVWGNGTPAEVNARAAKHMIDSAKAAAEVRRRAVVNGFTGSSIWPLLYSFPPVSAEMIDDGFKAAGRAVQSDPRRVRRVRREVRLGGASDRDRLRPAHGRARSRRAEWPREFGFNFDPAT